MPEYLGRIANRTDSNGETNLAIKLANGTVLPHQMSTLHADKFGFIAGAYVMYYETVPGGKSGFSVVPPDKVSETIEL